MSFYKTNRNAPRTNRTCLYICGHDVEIEFALRVRGDELDVEIIEAMNANTGKGTGLPDSRLIQEVKDEVRIHGLMAFSYQEM